MDAMKMTQGYVYTDKLCHRILITVLGILALLVAVDIYLITVSPYGCHTVSKSLFASTGLLPHSHSHGHEHTSVPIDNLFQIEQHKGQNGIVFKNIKVLEDMSVDGDKVWDQLLATSDGGYLYLVSNESTSSREPWGVSMFHGLHCLQVLRHKIQELENMSDSKHQHEHHDGHDEDDEDDDDDEVVITHTHYRHCFAYIAQSLICAADDTLEPPHFNRYKNGTFKGYNIDGVGTWHQCRDRSHLWEKVLEGEKKPLARWNYQIGDTIESVWGQA